MAIAALWGTTVGYTDYTGGAVVVETMDNRVIVISRHTFNHLYYKLDEFNAALKDDCIHYANYMYDKATEEYPKWYQDAVAEGIIGYNGYHDYFYEDDGEIAMSPRAVVLMNKYGELKYMERHNFYKYFDVSEECY